MKTYIVFLVSIFFFVLYSCDDECPQLIDSGCYSFDIRQCQTDAFAADVPESDSQSVRESKMKDWLENQGVFVDQITLDIGFHEAVCEACDVCPQGDRYFVQLQLGFNIEELDLLNLEQIDCCEHF